MHHAPQHKLSRAAKPGVFLYAGWKLHQPELRARSLGFG